VAVLIVNDASAATDTESCVVPVLVAPNAESAPTVPSAAATAKRNMDLFISNSLLK
jgi:hypothetical protein